MHTPRQRRKIKLKHLAARPSPAVVCFAWRGRKQFCLFNHLICTQIPYRAVIEFTTRYIGQVISTPSKFRFVPPQVPWGHGIVGRTPASRQAYIFGDCCQT